jgi:hypothetical protein
MKLGSNRLCYCYIISRSIVLLLDWAIFQFHYLKHNRRIPCTGDQLVTRTLLHTGQPKGNTTLYGDQPVTRPLLHTGPPKGNATLYGDQPVTRPLLHTGPENTTLGGGSARHTTSTTHRTIQREYYLRWGISPSHDLYYTQDHPKGTLH